MKIQTKIILSIVPVLLAGFFILSLWTYSSLKKMFEDDQSRYIESVIESRVAQTFQRRSDLLTKTKMEKVHSFLNMYQQEAFSDLKTGVDSQFGYFFIYDENGSLIFYSRELPPEAKLRIFTDTTRFSAKTQKSSHISIQEERGCIWGTRYFEPWKWTLVYAVESSASEKAIGRILFATFGLTSICVFVCACVIITLLSKVFVTPISVLKEAAGRIAKRETNVFIDITSKDELGDLSLSLNEMSAAISDYFLEEERLKSELQQSNESMKMEIKERRRIQDELKEAHDKLTALLDATPDIFFEVDLEGRIYDYHTAKKDELYVIPEKFLGKTMRDVLPTAQADLIMAAIQKAALEGKYMGAVYDLEISSEKQWFELSVATKGEALLSSPRFIAIAHNITNLKRAEEENSKLTNRLNHAQKMEAVSTLAGGIAHDFNNILTVIIGNISYAISMMDRDDALYEALYEALKGSEQAKNLTFQLLTFAKGGEPIKLVSDINKILTEAGRFVTSGAKSICEYKLADDLWPVEVDQGQINQVISNIIINADQAMPKGGTIVIKTENIVINEDDLMQLDPGRYIRISVKDQGIGILKDYILSIFDPYFTTKQKGNGLGLATSYSIVKKHGGHIAVFSEIGVGTIFEIYLPASLSGALLNEEEKPTEHKGKGRVLIMDDQASILKLISKMIEKMGYESEFATDGNRAIEKFREAFDSDSLFDLVILDLTIPGGMGGADTIPELLKIDPDVKIIISSGYSNDPIMSNYRSYGVSEVIQKPYRMENLEEVFNKIFGQ